MFGIQDMMNALNDSMQMARSNLRLGKLIEGLQNSDKDKPVVFSFIDGCDISRYELKLKTFSKNLYILDGDADSYRGYYCDIALDFEDSRCTTAGKLAECLKNKLYTEMTGYKGGRYLIKESTPVWISNYGDADGIRPLKIVEREGYVELICDLEND